MFLLIKEKQISQDNEFSAFLCKERCKSLGSLKSFLSYASQLSGASFSYLELPWGSPSGVGSGCSLIAAMAGILLFECPEGSQAPHWGAAIADDCDFLAY